jgi:hypothetical protein
MIQKPGFYPVSILSQANSRDSDKQPGFHHTVPMR